MAERKEVRPSGDGRWCPWCGTFSPVGHETRHAATAPSSPEVVRAEAPARVQSELRCVAGAVVFVAFEGLATLMAHAAFAMPDALSRIAACVEEIAASHNGDWEGELGVYTIRFSAVANDLVGAASRAVRATFALGGLLDDSLEELAASGIVLAPVFGVHVSDAAVMTSGAKWRPVPEVLQVGQELLAAGSHFKVSASDAVVAAVGPLVQSTPLDATLRRDRGAVFEVSAWRGAALERPSWSAEGVSVASEEDVAHLVKRWKEVCEGEGSRSLTIVGPDGSGKRRLVEELLVQLGDARGRRLAVACATEPTRLVPLASFSEALLRLIDVDPADDDEGVRRRLRHACRTACRALRLRDLPRETALMSALIGRLLGLELSPSEAAEVVHLDPDSLRKHAFFAVQRLLQGLTTDAPRVLVIENLHEADSTTLDLLDYLGSNAKGHGRIFIITTALPGLMTSRPSWGRGWWRHETLSFEALGQDELMALGRGVAGRAGIQVPDWLLGELADRADGSPYFMEQLVHLAMTRGIDGLTRSPRPGAEGAADDGDGFEDDDEMVFDEGPDEVPEITWPDDLQATAAERLTRLPAEHARILEAAATVGTTFPASWVDRVLRGVDAEPLAETARILTSLEVQGFLRRRLDEDVYRFRGEALWRAARLRVTEEDQETWNRRVALLLESDARGDRPRGAYGRVAVHQHLGGQTERAITSYALGARRARTVRALDEAQACISEALGLAEQRGGASAGRDTVALHLGRGQLRLDAGDLGRAIDDLEAAAELARVLKDGRRECEALFLLAAAYDRQGLLDRAAFALRRAGEVELADDDPRLRVGQLRRAGWLRYRAGDLGAARDFLKQAVDVARHSGVDLRHLVQSIDDLAVFHWVSGAEGEAVAEYTDLLAYVRRAGPAFGQG